MPSTPFLSFHLLPEAEAELRQLPTPFKSLFAELLFLDKYSRKHDQDDPLSPKETFADVVVRVTNGTFSILKDHCDHQRLPWDEHRWQKKALAFARAFTRGIWSPPGRGTAMMGTSFVHDRLGSAALQNCGFTSTHDEGGDLMDAMAWLMDASMLGVGVGFNDDAAGKYAWREFDYSLSPDHQVIHDSREGWVSATEQLLRRILVPLGPNSYRGGVRPIKFVYDKIRGPGELIRGMGGTSAGPDPLIQMHQTLIHLAAQRAGNAIRTEGVADAGNIVGRGVVMGNVRRTAEIFLGEFADVQGLKDYWLDDDFVAHGPSAHRADWGHLSNNSAVFRHGDKPDWKRIIDLNDERAEPGVVFLDTIRAYGRTSDSADYADTRVVGVNPCGEQALESRECCTLAETYPTHCTTEGEFLAAIEHATLYAKAVTLLPTHWKKTNAVMQRNRRIGVSMNGMAEFYDRTTILPRERVKQWTTRGYAGLAITDIELSRELGVRESIRKSSEKPSGTQSKVFGTTPGVHWPVAAYWLQRVRLKEGSPVLDAARAAGYYAAKDNFEKGTYVLSVPVAGPPGVRAQHEVPVHEKLELAIDMQRYWADNQVSCTLSFRKDEKEDLVRLLEAYESEIKALSFMRIEEPEDIGDIRDGETPYEAIARLDQTEVGGYKQVPMHPITENAYLRMAASVAEVDLSALYSGGVQTDEASPDLYCSNDSCEVPTSEA